VPDDSSDRPGDPGTSGRPGGRPPRRDGGPRRTQGPAGTPATSGRAGSGGRGETRSRRGSRPGAPEARRDDRAGSLDRGGSRLTPRGPRLPEPRIPEGVTGKELDRSVHHQLRTLSKENAEGVAQHLVMVAAQMEADDLDAALAHAETAVRRAGRVPAAREALGMVAYRRGDFARALTEFRTARRLSGSSHLLPLMVDCERGLGRSARALDLAASPEAAGLGEEARMELAIVVSGVRRDLGQNDAALLALQTPALRRGPRAGLHRLHYAYADILLDLGREDEAREWFLMAATEDTEQETDAVERLEDLDGIVVTDLGGEEEDDQPDGADHPPEPTE
jgi:Tetratricopeptide repeat